MKHIYLALTTSIAVMGSAHADRLEAAPASGLGLRHRQRAGVGLLDDGVGVLRLGRRFVLGAATGGDDHGDDGGEPERG